MSVVSKVFLRPTYFRSTEEAVEPPNPNSEASMQCLGGFAVAKSIFAGGRISARGIMTLFDPTDSSDLNTASLTVYGGVSIHKSLTLGGPLNALGNSIQNIAEPVEITDAAPKGYVDTMHYRTDQPHIAAVGTLRELNVSGHVTTGGNVLFRNSAGRTHVLRPRYSPNMEETSLDVALDLPGVGERTMLRVSGTALEVCSAAEDALIVNGGAMIWQTLNVEGKINSEGDMTTSGTMKAVNVNASGSVTSNHGFLSSGDNLLGVTGQTNSKVIGLVGGNLALYSPGTGAEPVITIDAGDILFSNTDVTTFTSTNDAALTVVGGVQVGKDLEVQGNVRVSGLVQTIGVEAKYGQPVVRLAGETNETLFSVTTIDGKATTKLYTPGTADGSSSTAVISYNTFGTVVGSPLTLASGKLKFAASTAWDVGVDGGDNLSFFHPTKDVLFRTAKVTDGLEVAKLHSESGYSSSASTPVYITKALDLFTSGALLGNGRWGMIQNGNSLTLGTPANKGSLNFSTYNADSTVRSTWLSIDSTTGALTTTSTSDASVSLAGGIMVSGTTVLGNSNPSVATVNRLTIVGNATSALTYMMHNSSSADSHYTFQVTGVGHELGAGAYQMISGKARKSVMTVLADGKVVFPATDVTGGLQVSGGPVVVDDLILTDGGGDHVLAFAGATSGSNSPRFARLTGQDARYIPGGLGFRVRDNLDSKDNFVLTSSGRFYTSNTDDATGLTKETSPFYIAGGAGVGKSLYVGGRYYSNRGLGAVTLAPFTQSAEASIVFHRYTNFAGTNPGDVWTVGHNVGTGEASFGINTIGLGPVLALDATGKVKTYFGLDLSGGKISGVGTPTISTDAANKAYVDSVAQGLDTKDSVVAATTTAGVLATDFNAGKVHDDVTLAVGDRILIKDQVDKTENGIYVVTATGAPTRAPDFTTGAKVNGAYTFVTSGTSFAGNGFCVTNPSGNDVVGTHTINFTLFSGAGQISAGAGIIKSGNTLSVATSLGHVTTLGTLTGLEVTGDIIGGTIRKGNNSGVLNLMGGSTMFTGGWIELNGTTEAAGGTGNVGATILGTRGLLYIKNHNGTTITTTLEVSNGGRYNFFNTTDSTSSKTGAMTLAGGLGLAKWLNFGGGANSDGATNLGGLSFEHNSGGWRHFIRSRHNGAVATAGNAIDFFLQNSSTSTGSSAPGTGSTLSLTVDNTYVRVPLSVDSSSSSTGALQVTGGVGVGKKLYVGGGEVQLTNATSNTIFFPSVSAAPPTNNSTNTPRSTGTRLVLWPIANSGNLNVTDFAIGIDGGTLWSSVGDSGSTFKWYHGTTTTATLSSTTFQVPALSASGNITIAGTPTDANHATTKAYVDSKVSTAGTGLTLSGTTLSVNASLPHLTQVGSFIFESGANDLVIKGGARNVLVNNNSTGDCYINLGTAMSTYIYQGSTSRMEVSSHVVVNSELTVRGNASEGGQINLGYKGNTTIIGQAAASQWIIDVSGINSFRIVDINAAGAVKDTLVIEPTTGNVTIAGAVAVGPATLGTHAVTKAYVDTTAAFTAGTGLTLSAKVFSVNVNQPTVTSVGTLTGLAVSGNMTVGGTPSTLTQPTETAVTALPSLTVNGYVKSQGLDFGFNVAGREPNAGKCGYGLFTPNSLDIVGGGAGIGAIRKVRIYDQLVTGSASFLDATSSNSTTSGTVTIAGGLGVAQQVTATTLSSTAVNVSGAVELNTGQAGAGVKIYNGYNILNNRQLWFGCSDWAVNATNPVLRIGYFANRVYLASCSSDGSTGLPLYIGSELSPFNDQASALGSPTFRWSGVHAFSSVLYSTVDSSSATTGALTIAGGVGVGGKLYVGGGVNGCIFNRFIQQTVATVTYYKIATLPASADGTWDHLHLEVTLTKDFLAPNSTLVDVKFGNRGAFTYTYNVRGAAVSSDATIVAYNNAGATDIYIRLGGASQYIVATYSILNQAQCTVYSPYTSSTTLPSGGLLFDASQPTTYRPALHQDNTGTNRIFSSVDSTSTTSGALQVYGGIGLGGNLYVGSNVYANGSAFVFNNATLPSGLTMEVGGTTPFLNLDNNMRGTANKAVNTAYPGALCRLNPSDAALTFQYYTRPAGSTTDTLVHSMALDGTTIIYSTVDSTSPSSGSLQVRGGVGTVGNMWIGGTCYFKGDGNFHASVSGTNPYFNFAASAYILFDKTAKRFDFATGTAVTLTASQSTVNIPMTTQATSTSTGALTIAGGVGVGDSIWVGGGIRTTGVDGAILTKNYDQFTSGKFNNLGRWGLFFEPGLFTIGIPTLGSKDFQIAGYNLNSTYQQYLKVAGDTGNTSITSTTESTSANTGALRVSGGLGVGGKLFVAGGIQPTSATGIILGSDAFNNFKFAANANSGNSFVIKDTGDNILFSIANGLGVSSSFKQTTDSTSPTTGALTVAGGVGISGNLVVGGFVTLSATTPTSNTHAANKAYVDTTSAFTAGTGLTLSDKVFSVNASQPTITSLGSLSSLTVIGTLTAASGSVTGNLTIGGTPTAGTDAATKAYVDSRSTVTAGTGLTLTGNTLSVNAVQPNITQIGNFLTQNATDVYLQAPNRTMHLNNNGVGDLYLNYNTSSRIRFYNATIAKMEIVSGGVKILDATDSTSSTSGALTVAGGVGIASNLSVGGAVNGCVFNRLIQQTAATITYYKVATLPVSADATCDHLHLVTNLNKDYISSTSSMIDAKFGNRGGFTYTYDVRGPVISSDATILAYNNAGATDIYIRLGGTSSFTVATYSIIDQVQCTVYSPYMNSTTVPTGTLIFDASVPTTYRPTVQRDNTGMNKVFSSVDSSSTTSGALQVNGGVGLGGSLYVGGNGSIVGNVKILDATNSTSSTSGALQVAGGVGVGGKLFVNGGEVQLTNATKNTIVFPALGYGPPTTTPTRSAGSRLVLWPGSTADFAFGIDSGTLWSSVEAANHLFKWYHGTVTTPTATLSSTTLQVPKIETGALGVSGALTVAGGVEIGGSLVVGGFATINSTDLALGVTATTRGATGLSRALVKDTGSVLAINFNADFTGGVRVDSNVNILGSVTGTTAVFTGNITLSAPTIDAHAATKAYVDTTAAFTAGTGLTLNGKVFSVNASQPTITSVGTLTSLTVSGAFSASSGSVAGNLTIGGTPTAGTDAATKSYVDARAPTITAGTGLTLTGNSLSVNAVQTGITQVGNFLTQNDTDVYLQAPSRTLHINNNMQGDLYLNYNTPSRILLCNGTTTRMEVGPAGVTAATVNVSGAVEFNTGQVGAGVKIYNGNNTLNNRQLWFGCSDWAVNATNPVLRIGYFANRMYLASCSSDGSTGLPLNIGSELSPFNDQAHNLGSSSFRWNSLHLQSATLYSTTDSTSATAGGALTVAGGGSIAKNLWIGGTCYFRGDTNFHASVSGTNPYFNFSASAYILFDKTANSFSFATGAAVTLTASQTTVNIPMTTEANSTTTGALTVTGGVGVGGNVYVGSTVQSSSVPVGGAVVIAGGLAVTKRLTLGGGSLDPVDNNSPGGLIFAATTGGYHHFIRSRHKAGSVNNAIDFYLNTSSSLVGSSVPGTGNTLALTVDANIVKIPQTANSTSATTGALTVTGGVGVGGNVCVAGTLTSGGTDFFLGNTDQTSRGNSGLSRALVKDLSNFLTINYNGDFAGGTRINSNLEVTGKITCPTFKVTQLYSNSTAPNNSGDTTFNSSGGTLVFTGSVCGYVNTANLFYTFQFYIDGVSKKTYEAFYNQVGIHSSWGVSFAVTGIASGSHTFKITFTGTRDNGDRTDMVVTEYPF